MRWLLGFGAAVSTVMAGPADASAVRPSTSSRAVPPVALAYPDPDTLKEDESGRMVKDGLDILSRTRIRLPDHVGNRLNCTSCHLDLGRKAGAAPWVGVHAAYPQIRARKGGVDTLEDRVNDCFERSMNGKALPPGSSAMRAILLAMAWLSRDVPVGRMVQGRGVPPLKPPAPPSRSRGKALYEERCAACHGVDGQGVNDFPPLWGPQSFNIGAGMARPWTAASFIRANMPLGQGGTLTAQQAHDIAAWILSMPRPDFPAKDKDWPRGGKPPDCPY